MTDRNPQKHGIAGEDILKGESAAIEKTTSQVVKYDDERTSPSIGTAVEDIQAGKNVVYGNERVGLD